MKKFVFLRGVIHKILRYLGKERKWKSTADYWQSRYLAGKDSGSGSFNRLAFFKAKVINDFVKENGVRSVIEFGCGDGNQLLLAEYPSYIGYDIAEEAISICKNKFKGDKSKVFVWSGDPNFICNNSAELVLSLDVIYHLVEDEVFDCYMRQLFESSDKYVCIYSCNDNNNQNVSRHVKHRVFTDWIINHKSGEWELLSIIKNDYPYDPNDSGNTSWSDFYFYKRC